MKLKAFVLTVLLNTLVLSCYSQLKIVDFIKIADYFQTFYKSSPSTTTRSIYRVKKLGYDLSRLEWKYNIPKAEYFDTYNFLDLNNDGVKEDLTIIVAEGNPEKYTVTIKVTTDSFAQYKSWVDDIFSEPKYVNVLRDALYDNYQTENGANSVNYNINFSVPFVNSGTPGYENAIYTITPNQYTVIFTKRVPK